MRLQIGGVPPLDALVGDESEVVADEDARAEADRNREALVVAVAQADRILVAGVRALQRQQAEIAGAVFRDAVVFCDDLVAVHADCRLDEIHQPEMGQRHMSLRRRRRFEFAKCVILNRLRVDVKH